MALATSDIVLGVSAALVLVCLAALCSGLDLGLLSIDPFILEDLLHHGTRSEKRKARMLKPIIDDRHLLIVVILLGNAICMEVLPLVLEPMIGFSATVLLTTFACVFVCEILPYSIIYRNKITICAFLTPVVWIMIFCSFALAYPLARLLDLLLGKEEIELYDKDELSRIMELHGASEWRSGYNDPVLYRRNSGDFYRSNSMNAKKITQITQQIDENGEKLSYDEINMIKGILNLDYLTVRTIMRPISQMYMLDLEQDISPTKFQELCKVGYSRIPLYVRNKQNVAGILLTKQLIMYNPQSTIRMRDLQVSSQILRIPDDLSLLMALQQFRQGNGHMAAVISTQSFEVVGFITLEDVLEKVINEQIYDEQDVERASQS